MNKKTLLIIAFIIIAAIMAFLLYRVAIEEIQTRSSEPYPLAGIEIEDTITPDPSQNVRTPTTKFNVSPNFNIRAPAYTRLPMYEFNPSNNFSENVTNSLPSQLGLNVTSTATDPVLGKIIFAAQGTKNLVIYPDKGELTYTDTAPQVVAGNQSFGIDPDLETFQTTAEDFIRTMGLENTQFIYTSYAYVQAETDHVEVTDNSRNSNMIQLTYQAKIEDLPIIDQESNLRPNTITVWMNSQRQIAKVFYQSTGSVGNSFGNYQLLNDEEVKADLQTENTKAKLVNGDYPIGEPIESINVITASIAYLSVENYLVPVYILEANVRVAGNRSGVGYLLLEAIKK